MSEFECKYGHLMSSRDLYCPVCRENGLLEGVFYMDGLSSMELWRKERHEDEMERRGEDEDEDA